MAGPGEIAAQGEWVTVGVDNGGTTNNGTVLDSRGNFLVKRWQSCPALSGKAPTRRSERSSTPWTRCWR